MNQLTDQQLLREYAERRSDAAFAELVRRHVDLIHSAALRMVCDSHLAEDVTQGAFVALARSAPQLTERAVLSGWLHRTAQNIAAQTVRTDVRRRARELEAVAMNELLATESAGVWEYIAPHLDAALGELSEGDRDALMLRYFERKSAQEMAHVLGISDEAAQKRVSRAVERLRECFAKRGVTVGASGLAVVISVNAIQAAPAGLAVTISTAALAGTTIVSTATATATKSVVMTTLQKVFVGAILVGSVGMTIYKTRQASALQNQIHTLEQQQSALTNQLTSDRENAVRLAAAQESNLAEVARLRGEVTRLQRDARDLARSDLIAAPRQNQVRMVTAIIVTNLTSQAVNEDQIRSTIQTRVGDAYSRVAIDGDVRGLYGTGLFSSIRVIEESNELGMVLTYVVKEKTQAAEATQRDFPAGAMRFFSADAIRIVLPFYADLTGLKLDLHPEAADSPAKITLENDRDLARSEAIAFVERILREQAGLVMEYSTPGRASVFFDKSVMTNGTGHVAR